MQKRLILILILSVCSISLLSAQILDKTETKTENDAYITTLYLSEDFMGRENVFTLQGLDDQIQARIVFDFTGIKIPRSYKYDESFDLFIKRVRVGQFREDVMRLVFYSSLAEDEISYSIKTGPKSIIVGIRKNVPAPAGEIAGAPDPPLEEAPQIPIAEDEIAEDAEDNEKEEMPPGKISAVPSAERAISRKPEQEEIKPDGQKPADAVKPKSASIHRFLFPVAVIILLYQLFSYVFSFRLFGGFFEKQKQYLLKHSEKDYFKKARLEYIIFLIKLVILCILLLYSIFVYANYNILFR